MTKKIFKFMVVAAAVLSIASCKKDNPVELTDATVTFRKYNGGFYMKQDDSTALVATNITTYPYPKFAEKRGRVIYFDRKVSKTSIPGYKYTYDVSVNRYDSTMTKLPVASLGSHELDKEKYGDGEIGIYLTGVFPPSMVEDGYLSISFAFRGSGLNTHIMNLVTGADKDDPYVVYLHHDINGDERRDFEFNGMMAFPLAMLPDTGGKKVKLTLKWNSLMTGKEESTQFDYCSRKDWPDLKLL